MVSESEQPSSMANGEIVAEELVGRSVPSKKCQGQVPKKIHKAEREKLKRDQLNDLFSKLDRMLESDRQNNGKACILSDATRILRDLVAQVESLRKENAALQTESHYVTAEKNELRDENAVLQAQISDLQKVLRARMGYNGVWTNPPNINTINVPHPTTNPMLQQPTVIERAFTAPPRELQLFPGPAGSPDHEPSIIAKSKIDVEEFEKERSGSVRGTVLRRISLLRAELTGNTAPRYDRNSSSYGHERGRG